MEKGTPKNIDIDYKAAFEELLSRNPPGINRDLYQFQSENTRKAMRKWWNVRYRKPLK